MSFFVRWPAGFVPEFHGWVKNRSSGTDVWLRWEVPFRFPASIAPCAYDEDSGAVGGWYMGPVGGEVLDPVAGQAKLGDIQAEMLRTDLNGFNVPDSFTCPRCRKTSWNPKDRVEGYCGACCAWAGER